MKRKPKGYTPEDVRLLAIAWRDLDSQDGLRRVAAHIAWESYHRRFAGKRIARMKAGAARLLRHVESKALK